jgi:hypothetical protein
MQNYCDFGLVINDTVAANKVSAWLDLKDMAGAFIHTDFGAITCVLSLEACNDQTLTAIPVTDVTFTQPAGVAGAQGINVTGLRARYYRVRVASVSGSAPLKIAFHAKGA